MEVHLRFSIWVRAPPQAYVAPRLKPSTRSLTWALFLLPSSIKISLTILNRSSILVSMNKLSPQERAQVLGCLVEGNSIRATVRITGAAKNTVVNLLAAVGRACEEYQDRTLVNLPCQRIQVDEIWSFCGAKEKNVPQHKLGDPNYGDTWVWTALDADTKLAAAWMVGRRDTAAALAFFEDLAGRLANRIQLTTDGHRSGVAAVRWTFDEEVDFATLGKIFGKDSTTPSGRYSPPQCIGTKERIISGQPDPRHISTSFVERANLTMRMSMRRFTRLTNAFSKKIENHTYAVALHFMHYNFCRVHQTTKQTPAMASGLTDHVWSLEEIANLAN